MRILLASSNPKDKAFFAAAAAAASLPFSTTANPTQACEELQKDPATLIILDSSSPEQYKAFETAVSEKIGLFSAIMNPNNFFYVADCSFHEAPYLLKSEIFGHFIHRTFTDENLDIVSRLFKMAAAERAFGIEKYFNDQARSQTLQITQSLQKRAIVESLKNNLIQLGFKSRMATLIAAATDELIMNAIFDAPVDALGKHIYSQTPRNTSLDLKDKNIVEMKVIFDGVLLGVCVKDCHGSLDKKKLLSQHLGKSYEASQYETRTVNAGAGLGLAHVYRNCGGMVFSCENGSATEVSLFFKKTDSFKEFKEQFRFLSTFMYF